MPRQKLDAFTRAYIEAALWSTNDESDESGGEPLDANYSIDDIAPETMEMIVEDCADFQKRFGDLLSEISLDDGQAGHDFWLSRNGHGAGFFDLDVDEEFEHVRDALQDAAESYGEFDLYVGDEDEDGNRLIYGPPPDWYHSHRRTGPGGVKEAVPRPHRVRGPYRKPPLAPPRGHVVLPRSSVVRDFDTRQALVEHAQGEGATHVVVVGSGATLYFPFQTAGGSVQQYEEARARRQDGYWHLPAPGSRKVVDRLPKGAEPIEAFLAQSGRRAAEARPPRRGHSVRDYVPVDSRGRPLSGPTKDYGEAKRQADRAGGIVKFTPETRESPYLPDAVRRRKLGRDKRLPFKQAAVSELADELALDTAGDPSKPIPGGFRWSDPNFSAVFSTRSPEHRQPVFVVVSVFRDGSLAMNFFSDASLSGTAQYENISGFTYASADFEQMKADINWVRETVDGYAASWQQDGGDMDEARRPSARRSATRSHSTRRRSTRR